MSQVSRIQNPWLWPLIASVHVAVCVGCSSPAVAQRTFPFSAKSDADAAKAPTSPEQIQRVSYIEDRYPVLPEDLKPKPGPKGVDAILPKNVYKQLKNATGHGPDPKIARQLFSEAEALYAEGGKLQGIDRKVKFSAAGAKYAEAADRWPESVMEEDAYFMAGEAYFFADEYDKAERNYELLAKYHPNTRHMDTIGSHRFAIAQYWLDLDKISKDGFLKPNFSDKTKPFNDTAGHAFRVYDRMRIDDPTGKLSDDATLAAANAYFARGKYLKADDLYTDLRSTYPNSEHQFVAHFLGLKAKLNSYQGPDYSGDCLNDSEKLIKQIKKLFPAKAEEERDFLVRAFAEIRYKKSERLWTLARFHELRKEYGAANHYLEQITKEFEDTPFSDKAKERIPENAKYPPVPPQKLQWFIDLFPKRQPAKPLIKSDDPTLAKGKK